MTFGPRPLLVALAVGIGFASQTARASDTPVERGRYIAAIAACAGCHTPRTPGAAVMSGGVRFGSGPEAAVSANLTPDRDTGIGAWTDPQIATAIRDGLRPDGTRIGPPMPQRAYHGMSDADVAAVTAYLRSLQPVRNAIEAPHRDAKPVDAPSMPVRAVATGQEGSVARGRYLFEAVTHCAECHLPADARGAGKTFRGAHGPVVAPRLGASVIDGFSDEALEAIITQGVRPDGSKLEGPMPVTAYAHLVPQDRAAIIAFLRTPRTVGQP